MKTLIVDDDPSSHKILKHLLAEEHPEIEIVASAYNLQEGIELFVKYKPELLFLDIELPDGLGYELLSKIKQTDFQVVFITAHNKYALTAIRFGDLDFLLKPINSEDLSKTIEHALKRKQKRITEEQIQVFRDVMINKKLPSKLKVSVISEDLYYEIEHIKHFKADDSYTLIFINGESKAIISTRNLGHYVNKLEIYPEFLKIHRSNMINLRFVKKYNKSEQQVILKDGSRVDLARSYLDEFYRAMAEI
ncbi:MAG: LytTR family DNA-binding domain-containing protein [Bacteroidia bacterium]|nr:LytTR family DNA-binding domain-containing protein [Bacteroidia bacterium]